MTVDVLGQPNTDFIADQAIESLLERRRPDAARIRDIVAKSLDKQCLDLEETADLLLADEPELVEEIKEAARTLKKRVYGNRIVLFAPLYVGNRCVNDCSYCGFRRSNAMAERATLEEAQLREQVAALERAGHKRLILVYGEHAQYSPEFIADSVRTVYSVKEGKGEIRRVNINAAPLDIAGYRTVKDAGIGTYQIFQETYHHRRYAEVHPATTRKGDYLWRLAGLDRAMEAGLDDVGIGALFGLHDWRFEVLGLVAHALHLQAAFNVGPHTISFPRIQPASGIRVDPRWAVSDEQFERLVAILRLAVPYTGLILTAREPVHVRRKVLEFGVSQIDGGTRIEMGGYTACTGEQDLHREQFRIGDSRSLDEIMRELMYDGYLPSFCTACYRLKRTGEHFMEFAIPGFIKRYCTPNAMSTLQEYLNDYASPETKEVGDRLIGLELQRMEDGAQKAELVQRLARIRADEARDLLF